MRRRIIDREAVDYDRPHHIYRAFDSYGLLLYVGCSLSVEKRIASHRSQARWFRYAETLAVAGTWDRAEALRRERHAIENEGPYFNSSYADMKRTQANHNAAKRSLWEQGWHRPEVANDIDPRDREAWYAAYNAIASEQEAWYRGVERAELRLKAGAFPFLTDADRLARYLAARADAELARLESAAA